MKQLESIKKIKKFEYVEFKHKCEGCGNELKVEVDFKQSIKIRCMNKNCKMYKITVELKNYHFIRRKPQ